VNATGPLLAFAAGLLSFLSPCVIPLIPSWLTFVSGTSSAEMTAAGAGPIRWRVLGRTAFFVLGFTIVFVALGVAAGGLGSALSGSSRIVSWVAGGVIALFGLNIIFDFLKLLDREKRFHFASRPASWLGSVLVGMAFAAGWTPCVGPILASILFVAGSSGDVARGTALLAAYSMGIGLPFLLAGLFFGYFSKQLAKIRPWLGTIRVASGLFLVALGVLVALGRLRGLSAFVFRLGSSLQGWNQANPTAPRLLFGLLAAALAALFLQSGVRRLVAAGRITAVRLTLGSLLAAISALILSGAIDAGAMVAGWLTFSGI
jgi:cytochrome c-type biogenesis protein